MSLEPAMAALAGLAVIGQNLSALDVVGIVLVVAASAGATFGTRVLTPVDA
jgi:inner membrane transporter RhtA